MKVCGFSIVRNAVKYNYPVVESIHSILPLVDRYYIGVGQSEDTTKDLLGQIDTDKIVMFDSHWDDSLRKGGEVLAIETNKVLDHIPEDFDWLFYLQADEVVHEKDLPAIREVMHTHLHNDQVEGLLFRYNHFYGTYDYIGDSRTWYRHEIRIIRNDRKIQSFRDAQGFRKEARKLNVKLADASVYHYGWVKDPKIMAEKMNNFRKMYHSDDWVEKNYITPELFDFTNVDSIKPFTGSHPQVMRERIKKADHHVHLDHEKKNFTLREKILYWIEKKTGKRLFEYQNYHLI